MSTISVVVPCYNGAKDLPRCLESLLSQTVAVEIIVVNDGSTDQTEQIAMEYAQKYSNIHVVTKANQGLPQARKTGLEAASGDLIGFVDSDDYVQPHMYEILLDTIEHTKADIACCGVIFTYPDGKEQIYKQKCKQPVSFSVTEALHMLHSRVDVFPYMWNKLFRRKVFEGAVFPEGNFIGEDYVTLIQLLGNADGVCVTPVPLYYYVQNPQSMSHGGFKPSHLLAYRNYQAAQEWLAAKLPQVQKDISCYLSVEYMSFVIAMSRNRKYDHTLLVAIQKYVCEALGAILKNKDMPLLYKGSAIAFCIDYRLLIGMYKLLG